MAESNFTIISNDFLDRTDISLDAMMVYIKIKRHTQKKGWEIKKEHVKKESGLGTKAFNRIWRELIDKELLISTCVREKGKFNYKHSLNTSKESYKKVANESKRINVDSNGQKPIDGQIGVEEALEELEKEEINKIIKATGATEEEAREELRVAKSKEGIKDIIQYTIGTINNKKRNEKELEKTVANKKQEINPKSFNNFPAREYDYDDLERKLLGWDKDEEEEQEIEFLN